jgi:signal peptidase I
MLRFFAMTPLRYKRILRFLWLGGKVLALGLVVFFSVRFFVLAPGQVNGRSMEPSFNDEDYFFVEKIAYLFRTPRRFEVVQIVDSENNKYLIKRVIALPGETVVILQGSVWLERGKELIKIEDSIFTITPSSTFPYHQSQDKRYRLTLGSEEYFVLGDNRLHSSQDSRQFGAVSRSKIVGRVIKIQR